MNDFIDKHENEKREFEQSFIDRLLNNPSNLTAESDANAFIDSKAQTAKDWLEQENLTEDDPILNETIKRAKEKPELGYLAVSKLVNKAKEINAVVESLEDAMHNEFNAMEDELADIKANESGKQKYIKGIECYLTHRESVLGMEKKRQEIIDSYFNDRKQMADDAYEAVKLKSSPQDLLSSDYMYIQQILNHGQEDDIAQLVKKYNWHPALIDMIHATRKDIKVLHPLQVLADPKFEREAIKQYSGSYMAALPRILTFQHDPSLTLPPWLWPLPDLYAKKDFWQMNSYESPQDAVTRLRTL